MQDLKLIGLITDTQTDGRIEIYTINLNTKRVDN